MAEIEPRLGDKHTELPQEFVDEFIERGGKVAAVLMDMFGDMVDPDSIEVVELSERKRDWEESNGQFVTVPPYISALKARTKQTFGDEAADVVIGLPTDTDQLYYATAALGIQKGENVLDISVGAHPPLIEREGPISDDGLDDFLREKMFEADMRIRTFQPPTNPAEQG